MRPKQSPDMRKISRDTTIGHLIGTERLYRKSRIRSIDRSRRDDLDSPLNSHGSIRRYARLTISCISLNLGPIRQYCMDSNRRTLRTINGPCMPRRDYAARPHNDPISPPTYKSPRRALLRDMPPQVPDNPSLTYERPHTYLRNPPLRIPIVASPMND